MPSKKKGGLGKGLGAFGLGESIKPTPASKSAKKNDTPVKKTATTKTAPVSKESIVMTGELVREIPVTEIRANRYQPRRDFDERSMDELKESIEQHGVLQPILVRMLPSDKGYELIAGERRFRAAKLAGLASVPVIIRTMNDTEVSEVALIENLQREDLNAVEEALAYKALIDGFALTQETLAKRLGRSRVHITNTLRLLQLTESVQEKIIDGSLSMGQVRPLVTLSPKELQEIAAEYILDHDLSARAAERLAKKLAEDPTFLENKEIPAKVSATTSVFLTEAEDRLRLFFGTQVRIKSGRKKKTIEIDFNDDEDLTRILESVLETRSNTSVEDKKAALRSFSTTGKFTV